MKVNSISNNINNINFKAKLSRIVKDDIYDYKWFLEQEFGKDSKICLTYQKKLTEIKKLCPNHTIYKKGAIDNYGTYSYDFVVKKGFGEQKPVGVKSFDAEDLYSYENLSRLSKFLKNLDEEEKYNAEFQRRMNYKRKKFFKKLLGLN